MKIISISGSLRARSSTAAVLRAAGAVAPVGIEFVIYDRLGELPHFNPDLDGEGASSPAPVAELRALLDGADAVLICSPEYAHGPPGSLKNALDWLVSSTALSDKALGVITASPTGGEHAHASLLEVLRTMSARIVPGACLRLVWSRSHLDGNGEVSDPSLLAALRRSVDDLVTGAREPLSTG